MDTRELNQKPSLSTEYRVEPNWSLSIWMAYMSRECVTRVSSSIAITTGNVVSTRGSLTTHEQFEVVNQRIVLYSHEPRPPRRRDFHRLEIVTYEIS
jgi:hypothetical protein